MEHKRNPQLNPPPELKEIRKKIDELYIQEIQKNLSTQNRNIMKVAQDLQSSWQGNYSSNRQTIQFTKSGTPNPKLRYINKMRYRWHFKLIISNYIQSRT